MVIVDRFRDGQRYARCAFVRPITFAVVRDGVEGQWCPGRSIDLSFGEIRFLTHRRLHVEDLLRIQTSLVTEEPGLIITARVAEVSLERTGDWLLRCEFLPSLLPMEEAPPLN